MFQLWIAKNFRERFLSSVVFVLLLLWINWNVLEYACKLSLLFIPMNFLIHNWYGLILCIRSYWHVKYHLYICLSALYFCVWNHVLQADHMLYIFICKDGGTLLYHFLEKISRSDCLTGTSKYVIPFPLWWRQVIMELSLSNVLLPLSFNPLFLGFLPNFIIS
jgi:hypothetical protein